jgi:hypothetical protein
MLHDTVRKSFIAIDFQSEKYNSTLVRALKSDYGVLTLISNIQDTLDQEALYTNNNFVSV